MATQQTLVPTVPKGATSSSEMDGKVVDVGAEFSDSRGSTLEGTEPFLLISNSQIS